MVTVIVRVHLLEGRWLVSNELTTAETAKRLGVTTQAIAKWIRRGLFPNAYKVNPYGVTSPYRIPEEDVEAFERERRRHSAQ